MTGQELPRSLGTAVSPAGETYLWRRGPESNRPTRICNRGSTPGEGGVARQKAAHGAPGALETPSDGQELPRATLRGVAKEAFVGALRDYFAPLRWLWRRPVTMGLVIAASLTFILSGCGGGGDAPLSTVQAQTVKPVERVTIYGVLRPDPLGHWYIMDDSTHAAYGFKPNEPIEQAGNTLVVRMDRQYTHAGVVQVTSDDGFNVLVSGHASLGVDAVFVTVWVRGVQINPSDINSYVTNGNGNFWITAQMENK